MLQDLRFALRTMRKNPLLTLVTVSSLALGIGANTAIFSVVNALMLRPLPYREPQRLVKVYQTKPDPAKGMLPSNWSYPRFEILRDQSQAFLSVAGVAQSAINLTGTNDPERLQIEMVSASYFPLLGVDAAIGRVFIAEEDRVPEANLVALLGHGLWQRRYGANPQVIGQTIELDKHLFTIVGVLPPGFSGQNGTADIWTTMMASPLLRFKGTLTNPRNYWFQVIARLNDGVNQVQAQSELQLVTAQIEQKYPAPRQTLAGATNTVTIVPLQSAKLDPGDQKLFSDPAWSRRSRPVDRMRKYRQPAFGARRRTAPRVCAAVSTGCLSPALDSPVAHRKRIDGSYRRRARRADRPLGAGAFEDFPTKRRCSVLVFLHQNFRFFYDRHGLACADFQLCAGVHHRHPVRSDSGNPIYIHKRL